MRVAKIDRLTDLGKSWSIRGGALLAGFAVCLALVLSSALAQRWVTDDALITFRYVDNLLAGQGLVYNPGERLEAFSSPLFVALLLPSGLLGASPFVAAQVLGLVFTVVELGLIFALLARYGSLPLAALLAGLLFAGERIVHVWATGGLETALYSALLFASFALAVTHARADAGEVRAAPAAVVHLLLATARPEGVVFYALYLGALVLGGREGAWKGRVARSLAIVGGGLALLLALRFAYYGALLPHTYEAKLAGVPVGVFGRGYVHAFARREGFVGVGLLGWLAAVAVFAASAYLAWRRRAAEPEPAPAPELAQGRRERRELRAIAALGLLYVALGVAVVWLEGGDYMSDFRLLRPLLGVLFATVAALVGHGFTPDASIGTKAASLAVALALLFAHGQRQREPTPLFPDAPEPAEHKRNNATSEAEAAKFRAALERFAAPGDAILTDTTGYKGYGHQLYTVDATGLSSPQIEGNFYLRPMWATKTYRDRLPGHARWPKLEFLRERGFALISPKISLAGHEVPEITESSHRRYRRYRFLHVTLALGEGEYLRFFTTLTADELAARAQARGLDLCWRAPLQDQPFCASMAAEPEAHEPARRPGPPEQPPGIEAGERRLPDTAEAAVVQYFGAMRAADCEWLRALTAGVQAERDAHLTCAQLRAELEHMAPVRLWEIEWQRPGREPGERLLRARFFLEGKDRVKVMRVAEIDGQWRVTRL